MGKSIEVLAPQRFLLFPGSLGDFLCLLPAINLLRENPIHGNFTIAAREESLEVASWLPGVTQTISLDRQVFVSLFSSSQTLSNELLLLFSSALEIVSWFGHSSSEVRAALERVAPQRVRSFAFFSGQENCHACLYYVRCLGGTELRCPSLILRDEERLWGESYWQEHTWSASTRVMVMHPGSGGKRKRWEVEGFIKVAQWWKGVKNSKLLILLGPAEEGETIWQSLGTVERFLPLRHLAALLNRAELYHGNDSGISHLAGAMGARGVVLFGPTSPQQWRPLGGALSVVRNDAYRMMYPDRPGISLEEIPVDVVLTALMRIGV